MDSGWAAIVPGWGGGRGRELGRTLVNGNQEALVCNDLVDIGLLAPPAGAHGASWQGFTLVLSLQPENSCDFMNKELFVHSARSLQANVLMIK